jgi:DeoR/GlpR family transcriptional regulator of sugar metabolism
MLEFLFSNKNVEKVLMYLCIHGKVNASELSKTFKTSLDPVQKTLRKLEEGGLLASFLVGKTRVFQWNPRYPFLEEIQALAKKAYTFLPSQIQKTSYQSTKRKRPRRSGKPLHELSS